MEWTPRNRTRDPTRRFKAWRGCIHIPTIRLHRCKCTYETKATFNKSKKVGDTIDYQLMLITRRLST